MTDCVLAALYTKNKFQGQETYNISSGYNWTKKCGTFSLESCIKPDFILMNRLAIEGGACKNDEFKALKQVTMVPLVRRKDANHNSTHYNSEFIKKNSAAPAFGVRKAGIDFANFKNSKLPCYSQPQPQPQKVVKSNSTTYYQPKASKINLEADKLRDRVRGRNIQLFPKHDQIKVNHYASVVQDSKTNLLRTEAINNRMGKTADLRVPGYNYWKMKKFTRVMSTGASVRVPIAE